MSKRHTILIVDDMEINRELLAGAFEEEYDILQAENGEEALEIINDGTPLAAVLLDLLMPKVDGLGVLENMNNSGKIRQIPVFLITAADSEKMLMDGYQLGAVDVITKPFLMQFLKCRVNNMVELYMHRNDLEAIVREQVSRLNALNHSMIETLATIIEFRDCESGEHVKRICDLTETLMIKVGEMYPEYAVPKTEIEKIVNSAVLHDVGKIAIPDSILNKPGRLTDDEFRTMKLHTVKGCEILQRIPSVMTEDMYNYSYDICRHHHERWDGRGYPDGLKGDEISIWAQVVALADVYDALTSPRCYKPAFTHEKAVHMIFNHECGVFNPKLLRAFEACMEEVRAAHFHMLGEPDAGVSCIS